MTDFYGSREEELRIELLSLDDEAAGTYETAHPAIQVDSSIYARIRAGGVLDVVDDTGAVDWLATRLRVIYLVNGTAYPRGVFIPATPTGPRARGASRSIELYDKTLVLDEDAVEETYVVDVGEVVTDVVGTLVMGAGETLVIAASAETVAAQTTWSPGTPKLTIVNDLLASIDYVPLYADRQGQLRSEPYVPPSEQGVTWTFDDGMYTGLYLEGFEDEQDLFHVPNKIICISRTDGEEPALTSVVTNTDPGSRFSYANRGRWITRVSEDVEATSQSVLDTIAQRWLTDATSASRTLRITHAWVPIELNTVVRFQNADHGIDMLCRVVKMEERLEIPGALVTTTLKEV